MNDAPENIWAAYPASGKRVDQTIYGYDIEPFGPNDDDWIDDDFDDPTLVAEYTRTDIADARIKELEAALRATEKALHVLGVKFDFYPVAALQAREALKGGSK